MGIVLVTFKLNEIKINRKLTLFYTYLMAEYENSVTKSWA